MECVVRQKTIAIQCLIHVPVNTMYASQEYDVMWSKVQIGLIKCRFTHQIRTELVFIRPMYWDWNVTFNVLSFVWIWCIVDVILNFTLFIFFKPGNLQYNNILFYMYIYGKFVLLAYIMRLSIVNLWHIQYNWFDVVNFKQCWYNKNDINW